MLPLDLEGLLGALSPSGVSSGGGFSFAPYLLDPATMRLMREDELVKVPARHVTVLHALVDAGGKVVLKDHLIQIGWKQIVSDSSLEKLISELRKTDGAPHASHSRGGQMAVPQVSGKLR